LKTFAYPPPTDGKPFRLTLGLRELHAKEWFEAGSDVEEQLRQRRELIESSREIVYQQLSGHREAITYFMDRIVENLTTHHSEYNGSGRSLTHTPEWRRNWSLHTTSQLHEPRFSGERATPENYWWRTERQTLTKSPDGKYLLFTIRNRAEPFSWIKQDAEASKAFAETLRSLSDSMLDYKRIREDKAALINYLVN